MATQSVTKFEDFHFNPDGSPDGSRRLRYEYDDATLLLTAVYMLNTTANVDFPASATVDSNGRTFSHTEPAGGPSAVEFSQNVPTNVANRMQLFINTKGWLDGISWNIG